MSILKDTKGGVTLVLNGDRRAAGGDVRFEISQGQWQGLPKMRKRVVDEAANEIRVTLSYPDSAKHMGGVQSDALSGFCFRLYYQGERGKGLSGIDC